MVLVSAIAVVKGREMAVAQVVSAVLRLALFWRRTEHDLGARAWTRDRGHDDKAGACVRRRACVYANVCVHADVRLTELTSNASK